MIIFTIVTAFLFMYFAPAFVALCRSHPSEIAIVVLNLFLGWTFFGWVIALIWACTDTAPRVVVVNQLPPPPVQP